MEVKSNFPSEVRRVARQLAGHANAAGGEPIIWIFGLDQETRCVTGVSGVELSDWQNQLRACFDDGVSPQATDVVLEIDGRKVIAMSFETERAPYMIKSATGGSPELEVPWREGTRTRSANRSELLRLLVEKIDNPSFEILAAAFKLNFIVDKVGNQTTQCIHAETRLRLYIYSSSPKTISVPAHHVQIQNSILDGTMPWKARSIGFGAGSSQFVRGGSDEFMFSGPGRVDLIQAEWLHPREIKSPINSKIEVSLPLREQGYMVNLEVQMSLKREGLASWWNVPSSAGPMWSAGQSDLLG